MRPKPIVFLAAIAFAASAGAAVYKCRLADGRTEIANVPCAKGSSTLAVRPEEVVPEASRQQAERDLARMRRFVEKREAAQRADEAAERQARASQRQAAPPLRSYGDPEACLRELSQQILEAAQRATLEAECRSRIKPPAGETPYPVVVPVVPPMPPMHRLRPTPAQPAPPPAPTRAMCPPANKNCR